MTLPASHPLPAVRRVILVSTSRDLAAHRERVREALAGVDGLAPLPPEPGLSGLAGHGDVDSIAHAARRGADICVLLVAWRYGEVPPGELRSTSHRAYLEARAAGIPILVFLADPATDALAGPNTLFPAATRDLAHRAQLLAFRAELEFAHAVHYFTTPGELAASVTSAATALLADLRTEQRRQPRLLYPRGPRTPRDLPPRVPSFVGRERERAALLDALRRRQSVSLSAVVAGTAGIGTSTLAAEALHALASEPDAFPGGIAWVRCDARSGLDGLAWIYDRVLAAWGALLPSEPLAEVSGGAPAATAAVDLRERALRQLRPSPPPQKAGDGEGGNHSQSPALLLLDNVERRLPLDRALEALAPLAVTVLVTARHRPASPHLRLLPLDVLDTAAAIRLFAARYRDRGGSWDTDPDAVAARFVVELLGRLPLAIELAAARAACLRLSIHALGDELAAADRQGRLMGPLDTTPGVRYILDQTLATLSSAQRARFATLALPDGPDWPLPIVERLLAAVLPSMPGAAAARADLETFATLSLITISPAQSAHASGAVALPRVHLHPLLRDLALAEWERQPDEVRRAATPALLAAVESFVAAHRADTAALAREEELMRGALRAAARYVDAGLLAATASRWVDSLRTTTPADAVPALSQPSALPVDDSGASSGDVSAIATARLDPPTAQPQPPAAIPDAPPASASASMPSTTPAPAPPSLAPTPDPASGQTSAPTRRRRRWWPLGRKA